MNQLTAPKGRVQSIDIVRGIVMIIMALDHVRDYFHNDAFLHDPVNPATTTPILFFTRWITHFCAPVFIFLAGTSAYLSGKRKTKAELSSFLVKRGFWLIFIEIVVINLANVSYLDNSGLGQLCLIYTLVKNRGGEMKLLKPTPRIRKLLNITKLDTVLKSFECEADAIKSMPILAAALSA